jgi:uncharacterized protein YndB with AHSA1/START domain
MVATTKTLITVRATVNAPVESVWKHWTSPESVTQWNHASDDWHSPKASNDLRKGGKFSFRMEARDGSFGFDFEGIYDKVIVNKQIDYTMPDGRKVKTIFYPNSDKTEIVETFEAESTHTLDQQRDGWQSIMNNFKIFAETHK